MTVQPCEEYPDNPQIRDVGWFIEPKFHKKGYMSEAAKAILDFMFNEVEIEEILTNVIPTIEVTKIIKPVYNFKSN